MATYDKGDLVRCTGTFTNSDGDAVDPAAILFKVKDPSGNVTSYTYGVDDDLVKLTAGVYYVDVDADEVGEWWYRFYSTGVHTRSRRCPCLRFGRGWIYTHCT